MASKEAVASEAGAKAVNTKKRERRPNYTPEEKTYLARLVSQYQYIIDDKRTGGIFIKKKREAWKAVTMKYNSQCTTGHRQTEHLKTLYDNMKQQARRNDGECFTNTMTRLRLFQKPELVKSIEDNNNRTSPSAIDPTEFLDVSLRNTHNDTSSDPSPLKRSIDRGPTRSKKPLSAEALERLYYRKKYRNANLERKRILQDIFHAQQKHQLQIILLRRTLDKNKT